MHLVDDPPPLSFLDLGPPPRVVFPRRDSEDVEDAEDDEVDDSESEDDESQEVCSDRMLF